MTGYLELAARCEQATGPDGLPMERLCWEIWIAVNEPEAKLEGNGSDRGWKVRLGGSPLGGGKIIKFGSPPTFTASLDAAMTLVPETAGFTLQQLGHPCIASVFVPQQQEQGGHGATPALALTAAALRARHAQEPSK